MARTRRPWGRLFLLLAVFLVTFPMMLQATPATTTIADVVYRADGTAASGVLIISWPSFTTTGAIANRQILDETKFRDGISKIIDGTVECLNASIWAKPAQQ